MPRGNTSAYSTSVFDPQQYQKQSDRNWLRVNPDSSPAGSGSLYGEPTGGSVYAASYEGATASKSGHLGSPGEMPSGRTPAATDHTTHNDLKLHHPTPHRPRPQLKGKLEQLDLGEYLQESGDHSIRSDSVAGSDILHGGRTGGNHSARGDLCSSYHGSAPSSSSFSFSKVPLQATSNHYAAGGTVSRPDTRSPLINLGIRVSDSSRLLGWVLHGSDGTSQAEYLTLTETPPYSDPVTQRHDPIYESCQSIIGGGFDADRAR